MKHQLLLFLVLLSTMCQATNIVFVTNNQTVRYVVESDVKKISFSDSTLLLIHATSSTEIALDSLRAWYYETSDNAATSISDQNAADVTIMQNGKQITIQPKNTGEDYHVCMYSPNGMLLFDSCAQGVISYDISALSPGVYVITIGNDSYKIINR